VLLNQKNSPDLLKLYDENLAKNTMSAVAALTAIFVQKFPEVTVITSPTDQIVLDERAFNADLKTAYKLADAGNVVVLGTKMKHASSSFGYIHAQNGEVVEFTEKPDILTAEKYLRGGEHFVNSGIYVFKGAVLLQELQKLQPQLYTDVMNSVQNMQPDHTHIKYEQQQKSISIDDALAVPLAKQGALKMVQAQFEFEDIGTFESLLDYYKATDASKSRRFTAYLAIACTWLLRR
jgi:mannose-1-phosphate guanylyltransferase